MIGGADLVRDLIAAGVSAALVARVQAYVFSAESPRSIRGESSEIILSRRRKVDRERKKAAYSLRKEGGGKQTMSATFSEENSKTEIAVPSLTSLLSSSSVVPLTVKQESKLEVVARRDRGARIPDDWRLSPELTALALEHGHVPAEFETEFKDFWVGVPGSRGRKCDWEATARNRIKETSRRRNGHANGQRAPRPGSREDRAERTANAMEKLRNFANGHHPDDPRTGGPAREPPLGGLPFPKPA